MYSMQAEISRKVKSPEMAHIWPQRRQDTKRLDSSAGADMQARHFAGRLRGRRLTQEIGEGGAVLLALTGTAAGAHPDAVELVHYLADQ